MRLRWAPVIGFIGFACRAGTPASAPPLGPDRDAAAPASAETGGRERFASLVDAAPREASAPVIVEQVAAPIDAASAKVAAMLAGLPKRRISQREVCALVAAPGFHPPNVIVGFEEDGSVRVAEPNPLWTPRMLVPRCTDTRPYGETLTPLVSCESDAPRCTFYLVSGGRSGTPVPPTERTYWFETAGGRLTMVAVALPHLQ